MLVFDSNKMGEFLTPGSENNRIRTMWIIKLSNDAMKLPITVRNYTQN